MEPLWRNGTGIERPFSVVAGVACRRSSLPLQRVMSDFGADDAFRPGTAKLKEHYGIDMPVSPVQRTTEQHAESIYAQDRAWVIEIELERSAPQSRPPAGRCDPGIRGKFCRRG